MLTFVVLCCHLYIDTQVDSQGGVFGQRGLAHIDDPIETYKQVNKTFKELDIPFSTDSTVEDLRMLIC